MNFARIDKGLALLWISGALGLLSLVHLVLALAGWSIYIPELNLRTPSFIHSRAFVVYLVLSYVLYRIGASPDPHSGRWYAWFSGLFGMEALKNLVFLAVGFTLVIPQIEFVEDATFNVIAVIVGGAISYYLLKQAEKRMGMPAHKPTPIKQARKRR